MKKRAQELGLWNIFLPKAHFKEGAGFSNLEYGLMAEYLGKSRIASEVRMLAIVQAGTVLIITRLSPVLLLILAIWRSSPNMAPRHRRGSGSTLFFRARSDLPPHDRAPGFVKDWMLAWVGARRSLTVPIMMARPRYMAIRIP
jgi:hypothetical protein